MFTPFVFGAICMACFTIMLFFIRFWRRTNDRLFLLFAAAFALLMVERIVLVAIDTSHEFAPYVYVCRLLAFGLIIAGIVDKNRKARS